MGAAVGAGCLFALGTGMAVLFPGTRGDAVRGFTDAIPPAVGRVAVAPLCPSQLEKASALVIRLALPAFLIVPGAIGDNIGRFAWVATAHPARPGGCVPTKMRSPAPQHADLPVAAWLLAAASSSELEGDQDNGYEHDPERPECRLPAPPVRL